MESLIDASAWIIPVILAVTLHEAAHGWVAEKFGDSTARAHGRVTFNPFKHIDLLGTIILPALLMLAKSPVLFGYARPVPVDFSRLRPYRLGSVAVALAGVTVNLMLALCGAFLLHLDHWISPEEAPWLYLNFYRLIFINCVLVLFNLIPILPLDGGRALKALLPRELGWYYGKLEKVGLLLVLALLFVPPMLGITVLQEGLALAVGGLAELILHLAGIGVEG